jgi:hypothetical protein
MRRLWWPHTPPGRRLRTGAVITRVSLRLSLVCPHSYQWSDRRLWGIICCMVNDDSPRQRLGPWRILILRMAAIVIIAAIVIGTFIAFSYERVCNQEMTAGGKVVEVCRHLEATDPPVIAGGLVALAFLGVFYTEISGFGLSLKREVARTKDTAEAARGAARSAQATAQMAQDLSLQSSPDRSGAVSDMSSLQTEISTLTNEYNDTRRTMQSGPARTSKMTSIMSQMISMLNGVNPPPFELSAYLNSEDEGRRLAAYAYLYANPDPALTPNIAATLTKDKPFAQYWALRTLRRQLLADPEALDLNTRRDLEGLLAALGPGTDRGYELQQLLSGIPT